jgi:outer membrane protein, heavy metal efflux system
LTIHVSAQGRIFVNRRNGSVRCRAGKPALLLAIGLVFGGASSAQSTLSLDDAIKQAIESRASLKAESERIAAARALERQASLRSNPDFLFQNENLRPGQTYTRDVDTLAYLIQPLDFMGKRTHRIEATREGVVRTQAEYDLAKIQLIDAVKLAYWTARGAQEIRQVLRNSVANFQKTVDYHAARFSVGAIAEQDLLRVRLESERLKISANLAVVDADRATMELFREMGRPAVRDIVLTESLEPADNFREATLEEVLSQRGDIRLARAALAESAAKESLEAILARPDLSAFAGYKRTQLPDTNYGVNTIIAGFQITLPVINRNQGNREAADAEVRRRQQLLAAAEADVRAEYESALQEYRTRRDEATSTLQLLRQEAGNVAQIASNAYVEGGTDLLRLLDAERARIDADLAWARGMSDYHQSIVRLEAAEGVSR